MTAVEWLVTEIAIKNNDINFDFWAAVEQAKEMEELQAHQYAEFAIRCDRKDMKILNFKEWIKL